MAATDTRRRTAASSSNGSKRTKEAWGKRSVHVVTCPSGMEVKIRIPNVGLLLEGDALPQRLRQVALQEMLDPIEARVARGSISAGGEDEPSQDAPAAVTLDEVKQLYDLNNWLVVQTVLEPELTIDDLPDLPAEDLEMLIKIANRERTVDAVGKSLGTDPLSRWETFRVKHGCAEGCEACTEVRLAFSTVER